MMLEAIAFAFARYKEDKQKQPAYRTIKTEFKNAPESVTDSEFESCISPISNTIESHMQDTVAYMHYMEEDWKRFALYKEKERKKTLDAAAFTQYKEDEWEKCLM